jgi:hypothetical protein
VGYIAENPNDERCHDQFSKSVSYFGRQNPIVQGQPNQKGSQYPTTDGFVGGHGDSLLTAKILRIASVEVIGPKKTRAIGH